MIRRRLETVWAHERFARQAAVAIPPRCRAGRIAADDGFGVAARGPLCFERRVAVAAKVTRIGPQRPVLVEVPGREQVHRQRLHAFGHRAIPGRAVADFRRFAVGTRSKRAERADHPIALRQACDLAGRIRFDVLAGRRRDRHGQGRRAAHALEADVGDGLRVGGCTEQRYRDDGRRPWADGGWREGASARARHRGSFTGGPRSTVPQTRTGA